MDANTPLSAIENWSDFQKSPEGSRLFPNREGLRWFLSQNREKLVKAGALVKIRGQLHLVRPEFDNAVITLMREKAMASLAPRLGPA